MKVEDAMRKWCPFVRVSGYAAAMAPDQLRNYSKMVSGAVSNRGENIQGLGNVLPSVCLADGCMEWREVREGEGYCGMAGDLPSRGAEALQNFAAMVGVRQSRSHPIKERAMSDPAETMATIGLVLLIVGPILAEIIWHD